MKTVKRNSIVYVRSFEGAPLVRCTLKGRYFDNYQWWWVIKPLTTEFGYVRNTIDMCHEIIPAGCFRWSKRSFGWLFKPWELDGPLPEWDERNPIPETLT